MKTWKHCLLTLLLIAIGAIVFVALLNVCLELITAPNTLLNIAGVLGLTALPLLSVMIEYLVTFIKKKKND